MRLCLTLRLWLLFKHTILYFYLGVPVPSTSEQKIDMEKKRGLMAFMGSIKAVTGVTRGNWHWQCQVKTSGPCCCLSRLWLVAVLAILHDVLELSISSYSLHTPASIDALSGCRNSNWSIPTARNGVLSPGLPSVSLSRNHITDALAKSSDRGATLDLTHKNLTDVGEDGAEVLATFLRDSDDETDSRVARYVTHPWWRMES